MEDEGTVQVSLSEIYDKGYRAGIREVVWCALGELDLEYLIRARGNDITGMNVVNRLKDRLQAKLEEWGV